MTPAIDFAQKRAKKEWDSSRSRSPLAWLFRFIGASKVVTGVWICEHASGDWNTVVCKGEPKRIWRYDAGGFTPVDQLPELDRSAIASTTPVIRFCVDETARRMIYEEWHGVRSGTSFLMALEDNGKWFVEKLGPRS